jgi:hypothetical protein
MKRLFFAAALAAFSMRAEAQTSATPYVFTTVDAIEVEGTTLHVTGVLEGEPAARRITFYFSSSSTTTQRDSCERLMLLTMSKPGQYRLHLLWQYFGALPKCTLERVAP